MDELSAGAFAEVTAAFGRYQLAIRSASLTSAAKEAYLDYAGAFIRWLNGELNPADMTGIE